MEAQRRRYVLLDRDGVISQRIPKGHANCWEHVEFLPRALDALRLLAANGYAAIVIARDPGGTKRCESTDELEAHTRRMRLEVALSGGNIAHVYACRHEEVDQCNCGRPAVGLIARARADFGFRLEQTFFVGEYETSLRNAAALGCRWIQIQREAFLQPPVAARGMGAVASNLYGAAEIIVAERAFERGGVKAGSQDANERAGQFALAAFR